MGDRVLAPSVSRAAQSDVGLPGIDVLSKLGHELRGPLNGIIGLSRIMLVKIAAGAADTSHQVRQLEMIQASAGQLLTTVERVAELARLDAVPAPMDSGQHDVRPVIADVVAAFQAAAAAGGSHLRADVPERPVLVAGEPDQIRRLLSELVDNAVKYADPPEVRIRAAQLGPGALVEVSDDGPGIPAVEQGRLFLPFARGESAGERNAAGSGLGLCLARRIAARYGADLSLHSTSAPGSTFRVQWNAPGPQSTE
jgi:signal transduction histidine kinase